MSSTDKIEPPIIKNNKGSLHPINQTKDFLLKLLSEHGFEEIQVCIDYDKDQLPIYKSFSGWMQDTSNARSFDDLPEAAQDYILFIEQALDCSIDIVSVGPSREQTIYRN